jgi:hypothetical protein
MASGVQFHPQMVEHRRARACAPSQQGADTRGELVQVEGLHQVVIGAGVEARDPVRHRVARGDDEHRQRGAAPAQALEQPKPAHPGEA